MSPTADLILSIIGVLALAALYIGLPIMAARIAFRKGRKGWGIASIVSIFLLAGWLVGSIALFVKPGLEFGEPSESLKTRQTATFGAFFILPVLIAVISLSIRSSAQPTAQAAVLTPTAQPTETQVTCSPAEQATPAAGEETGSVIARCNCLVGSEVAVTGKLCMPRTVLSSDNYYSAQFLPADGVCYESELNVAYADLPVGSEANQIKPVQGDYFNMTVVTNDGKDIPLGKDGQMVTLTGKFISYGKVCHLRVMEIAQPAPQP